MGEDPYIIGRSQQHVQLLYTGRNIDNNHSLLTSTIDDIGMDVGSLSDAESATVSSANSCSSTNSLSSQQHRARIRHGGTSSRAISMCGIVTPITTTAPPPPATAASPCKTTLREKEENVENNNHKTTHHRSGTSRAIAMSGTTTTTPTPPPATASSSCQTTRREKEEEVERNNHKTTHRHRHHRRSASWSPPTTPPQSPSPTPPAPKTTESSTTSATWCQYVDNMATDDGFVANICGGLGTSTDLCNRNY